MARIVCPYCIKGQELTSTNNTCDNCNRNVPSKFIQHAMQQLPLWMVTIGAPSVGKSTYVSSLAITMKHMGKVSRGAVMNGYDEHTVNKIRTVNIDAEQGNKAPKTNRDASTHPLLLEVPNFMGNQQNPMVIYDYAGEIFDMEITKVSEFAPAIAEANTIWNFISLSDLEGNASGRGISDSFHYYLQGMEQIGASPRNRDILIILTKADKLQNSVPENVGRYLATDPYFAVQAMSRTSAQEHQFDPIEYYEQMLQISEELMDYCYDKDGYQLITMAEQNEMNIRFAITSAIGGDPINGKVQDPRRFRVLDPLVFAIKGNKGPVLGNQVVLIVDTTEDGMTSIQNRKLHVDLHQALSGLNMDVETYYLGDCTRHHATGQVPATTSLRPRLPFIGPLLDRIPATARAMVLTSSEIVDLADYWDTTWRERLYLLTTRELQTEWSYKAQFTPDQHQISSFAEDFHRVIPSVTKE